MLLYRDGVSFKVMGEEIHLYSEDFESFQNTVAEIDGHFHYLGNEPPNITAAIFAWQEVNGRNLTNEELDQVLIDNQISSEPI